MGAVFLMMILFGMPLWFSASTGQVSWILKVPKGATISSLDPELRKHITLPFFYSHTFLARIYQWRYGSLRSGVYHFASDASVHQIYRQIFSGSSRFFLVVEGSTQSEIAKQLMEAMDLASHPFLTQLQSGQPMLEGYLFPDTYKLDSTEPQDIIQAMQKRYQSRTSKWRFSKQELILASMIQKEGRRVSEFPRISGVFHNRMQAGWKLESDPTLQYVVGRIRLTKKVLENQSPYNSYLHKGLPPTPICNPGLAALRASREPEVHDFYYFVAKKDGFHHFSRSKVEHFMAVAHYQLGHNNGFEKMKEFFNN